MHSRCSFLNLFLILPAATLLFGCMTPADSSTDAGSAAADSTAAVEAIKAQAVRLSEAYMAGDIEGVVAIYADDGVAGAYNSEFVRGREDLLEMWELPEGRTILRHSTEAVELIVDGDHAYDWGYFEGQGAQDGEPLDPFSGKYVIVWERGDDGVWRMTLDVWSGVPTE